MYARRILHHGPDPQAVGTLLSDRTIAGCWFELHRLGGCGAGELSLNDRFTQRNTVEIGDWISFEYAAGSRWYLGRVEQRQSTSPAKVRLRLEGMGVQLNEVFPGGFGSDADGVRPHRFAADPRFSNDPDRSEETNESVDSVDQLVRRLIQHYVAPATSIQYDGAQIEAPQSGAPLASVKFRGEESVRSIIKQLAVQAGNMSWGVDTGGTFFFKNQPTELAATYREGRDLLSLTETRERSQVVNRILLTGGYVYDVRDHSQHIARRSYRWRANYVQPASRSTHGDRRAKINIPWVRTPEDAERFAREFFRIYAQPVSRYAIEVHSDTGTLPIPWLDTVRVEDESAAELLTGIAETVRISFDHAPTLRLQVGPPDPRTLWPDPGNEERWELPDEAPSGYGGGDLTFIDPPWPPASSVSPPSQSDSLSLSSDPPSLPSSNSSNSADPSSNSLVSSGSSNVSSGPSGGGSSSIPPHSSSAIGSSDGGSSSGGSSQPGSSGSSLGSSGGGSSIPSSAASSDLSSAPASSVGGSSAVSGSSASDPISSPGSLSSDGSGGASGSATGSGSRALSTASLSGSGPVTTASAGSSDVPLSSDLLSSTAGSDPASGLSSDPPSSDVLTDSSFV